MDGRPRDRLAKALRRQCWRIHGRDANRGCRQRDAWWASSSMQSRRNELIPGEQVRTPSPSSPSPRNGYLRGMAKSKNRLVALMDREGVLPASEEGEFDTPAPPLVRRLSRETPNSRPSPNPRGGRCMATTKDNVCSSNGWTTTLKLFAKRRRTDRIARTLRCPTRGRNPTRNLQTILRRRTPSRLHAHHRPQKDGEPYARHGDVLEQCAPGKKTAKAEMGMRSSRA